jgi:hypothetical protein
VHVVGRPIVPGDPQQLLRAGERPRAPGPVGAVGPAQHWQQPGHEVDRAGGEALVVRELPVAHHGTEDAPRLVGAGQPQVVGGQRAGCLGREPRQIEGRGRRHVVVLHEQVVDAGPGGVTQAPVGHLDAGAAG